MSKCDLSFSLDSERRRFKGGDQISGALRVQVNAACACKALTVKLEWRTHGRGNKATGGSREVVLFEGEWQPGKTHEYEFSLTVPDGPITYHGHVLNVDWYLSARADIPWAIDPKAEEEILVLPGPVPFRATAPDMDALHPFTKSMIALQNGSPSGLAVVEGQPGKVATGCFIAILTPFILIGLAITISGFTGALGGGAQLADETPAFVLIPFGLLFLLVPLFILLRVMRNRLAGARLGPVSLEVGPANVRPGDTVSCRLSFQPTKEVELEGIEAALVGRERVVSGSGTNQTTHDHELSRVPTSLGGPKSVMPGKRVEVETSMTIPADAAPSFIAPDNWLSWFVEVRIKVRRWPDWVQEARMVVEAPVDGGE